MEDDCCRICLSKTQILERQDLFLGDNNLSVLGQLYEEVLNISLGDEQITIKYICNSCGLQLKLFKQLKNKAFESFLFLTELFSPSKDDNIAENEENIQFETNEMLTDDADASLSCDQTKAEYVVENEDNTSLLEYRDFQDNEQHNNKPTEENDNTESDTIENDIVENEITENDDIIANYSDENAVVKNENEMEEENEAVVQIEEAHLEDEKYSIEEFIKHEENIALDTSDEEVYEVCYLDDEDLGLDNSEKEMSQGEYNEEYMIKEDKLIYEINPSKRRKAVRESFQCPHCDETFELKSHLKNHERKVHSFSTKIQCHICNKGMYSKETYEAHMNVHNGLPAYQCNICEKAFNQKVHYNYHMLNHKNERNNICDVCQKGFISTGDLKTHMRSHTDERRYKCDICDKRFRAHTHMVNHRYSHFEKQFECPVCFQKYMSPNTLKTHFKDVHSSEVPFECEFCEKRFKRKHHLQAHYRTHGKMIGSITILDD
ncbi:zinc finger protein 836-like [Eupeodes corollae]|uniref:zinc finger protein 836-like n=1 Tax=Eupeodes corollae TaxID=290404 RepID=UPI0024907D62|nr:zinc finger protein 836-like [Eupeodes corollae]